VSASPKLARLLKLYQEHLQVRHAERTVPAYMADVRIFLAWLEEKGVELTGVRTQDLLARTLCVSELLGLLVSGDATRAEGERAAADQGPAAGREAPRSRDQKSGSGWSLTGWQVLASSSSGGSS
jgi:hypothetical protein